MDELFMHISDSETSNETAASLFEAILKLSDNEAAISTLVEAYGEAVTETEMLWRQIEDMPEFKERYSSREDAHADFLRREYERKKGR
ncbi:MAG: hypothetical protein IJ774_07535 [Selenomonadaceae bacterium]|nr:hypothetical protein [Selenomonadaceae bacterium]